MTDLVIDRVRDIADRLRDQAAEAEEIGKLTDETVALMKTAGNIRLLQPKKHGGPRSTRASSPRPSWPPPHWIRPPGGSTVSSGAPYQLAYADPAVAAEIWAEDVDTWVASPYAPQGVARPVDGGYIFNGRWQFSSGTDHCEWIFLGALLGDDEVGRSCRRKCCT